MNLKTMKKFAATALLGVASAAPLALIAPEADAGHHRHRARVGVGIHIGAPVIAAPFYHHRPHFYGYGYHPYYAPAYYPPVVIREQPVVYVEQPQVAPAAPAPVAPAPQAQQQYWYFCQDSQTYYPHAQTCGSPWQRVIPHAPQQQ